MAALGFCITERIATYFMEALDATISRRNSCKCVVAQWERYSISPGFFSLDGIRKSNQIDFWLYWNYFTCYRYSTYFSKKSLFYFTFSSSIGSVCSNLCNG